MDTDIIFCILTGVTASVFPLLRVYKEQYLTDATFSVSPLLTYVYTQNTQRTHKIHFLARIFTHNCTLVKLVTLKHVFLPTSSATKK
jgi:hypothetical protein